METLILGIFAAILQASGYLAYGFKVLKRDITPNATSWLMFAYGTALVLILEWDRNAQFALLILPAICALSSILVAVYCVGRTNAWWPEHRLERASFLLDITLTIAYLCTWLLLTYGIINSSERNWAVIFILVCLNLGIFTSFYPLLRQVYNHPGSEKALPWLIWTCAYVTLAFATLTEQGGVNELMLYPLINAFVHGSIGFRVAHWHWVHAQPAL